MKEEFYEFIKKLGGSSRLRESLQEGESVSKYISHMHRGGDYWQISNDEIIALYAIVKTLSPRTVVETGVGSGTSTETILKALPDGGNLFSIDPMEPYGAKGDMPIGFVVESSLKHKWNLLKGKSNEILPGLLSSIGEIGLFMHDSDHTYENIMFELRSVWPHLANGGVVVIDNYNWTNAPMDFCTGKELELINIADDMAVFIK